MDTTTLYMCSLEKFLRMKSACCRWAGNVPSKYLEWWKRMRPNTEETTAMWKFAISLLSSYVTDSMADFFPAKPDLDNTNMVTNYCGFSLCNAQWVSRFIHNLQLFLQVAQFPEKNQGNYRHFGLLLEESSAVTWRFHFNSLWCFEIKLNSFSPVVFCDNNSH